MTVTNMAAFTPTGLPPATFGAMRHCAAGPECACYSAGHKCSTVLSQYNPGPYCYCCATRRRMNDVRKSMQALGMSSAEVREMMTTARAVA